MKDKKYHTRPTMWLHPKLSLTKAGHHPNFPHVQSIKYTEYADQRLACFTTQRKQQNCSWTKEEIWNVWKISASKKKGTYMTLRGRVAFSGMALGEIEHWTLRGPAAILFISRVTCSDSIAKLFRACFYRVSHNSRDMLQTGVSQRCACVKLVAKGGVSHHFGEC